MNIENIKLLGFTKKIKIIEYHLLNIILLSEIGIDLGIYWFFIITYRMIIEKARYMNKGETWKHAGQ